MSRLISVYIKDGYSGGSHALLSQAASLYTGLDGALFAEPETATRGKPYFAKYPELHFSISHSGRLWACAMGETELGLDIQEKRRINAEGIARRFFHPEERAYLENNPEDFFRVWAAKESFCKLRGSGIDDNFPGFFTASEAGLLTEVGGAFFTHFTLPGGFFACLCTGEAAEIEKKWL